MGLMIETEPTH